MQTKEHLALWQKKMYSEIIAIKFGFSETTFYIIVLKITNK